MSCECICYFDCIFMLSVLAMHIRSCGVHLCICLCSFVCIWNTCVLYCMHVSDDVVCCGHAVAVVNVYGGLLRPCSLSCAWAVALAVA